MLDAGAILARVLNYPEIRELAQIGRVTAEHNFKAMGAIITNLKAYLTKISRVKGSRRTVHERAFRTVVAACSGDNIRELKLYNKVCEELV